jgi:hypothetical protein
MNPSKVFAMLFCLSVSALSQLRPFCGKWQTRISPVTGKSTITVNLTEGGGAVVLVNPDGSELKLPIFDSEVRNNSLEFLTNDTKCVCHWNLKLNKSKNKGLLKAGCGEMLIKEKVSKHG